MTDRPTLMLIADIAGYTRFMKFHHASLAHAQEIVARLLEVVIDAAGPSLRLAKLEGDAAFFYMPAPKDQPFDPSLIAGHAGAIYRSFHARAADLRVNTLCPCDGCQLTELAGIDVIVVHRMLKNDVPLPEYLLMTTPVHALMGSPLRERAAPLELDLDDLGATPAFYLDLADCTDALPPPRKLSPLARLARHVSLGLRTLPYELGLRKACVGFRNVPDAR